MGGDVLGDPDFVVFDISIGRSVTVAHAHLHSLRETLVAAIEECGVAEFSSSGEALYSLAVELEKIAGFAPQPGNSRKIWHECFKGLPNDAPKACCTRTHRLYISYV